MVSAAPTVASTATPISSLKYGKCHWSGASTTPSSEMNISEVIFLTRLLLTSSRQALRSQGRRSGHDELIARWHPWGGYEPDGGESANLLSVRTGGLNLSVAVRMTSTTVRIRRRPSKVGAGILAWWV